MGRIGRGTIGADNNKLAAAIIALDGGGVDFARADRDAFADLALAGGVLDQSVEAGEPLIGRAAGPLIGGGHDRGHIILLLDVGRDAR